jgi:hypothetical protein
MYNYPTTVYNQTLIALDAGSGAPNIPSQQGKEIDEWPITESLVIGTTFLGEPFIWQVELAQDYDELGQALSEMADLDEEDEWKVNSSVYNAARYVAAALMDGSFPAPRVFNHGPKSVVFNWEYEGENHYLTISENQISTLRSSPECIIRRREFSVNQLALQPLSLSIRAAYSEDPVAMKQLHPGTVSDSQELLS